MEKYKILIDTDIGDDIDDAFAIALAAVSPEIEIAGVTTVYKNTAARARQAAKLLRVACSYEVPVFAGEKYPLSKKVIGFDKDGAKPEDALPCQYDGGLDTESYSDTEAVDAIIRLSKENSGKLILVPIGPMTNIARALEKDPSICRDVAKIVCMGGRFGACESEWNVLCDPEAVNIVYSSGIPVYSVGLDVTLQCILDKDLLIGIRNSAKATNKLLTTWLDRWFSFFGFEKSVMHDPLAVAAVFLDVCAFRKVYAGAFTAGPLRGALNVSETPSKGLYPVFAAETVNKSLFYRILKERLL